MRGGRCYQLGAPLIVYSYKDYRPSIAKKSSQNYLLLIVIKDSSHFLNSRAERG